MATHFIAKDMLFFKANAYKKKNVLPMEILSKKTEPALQAYRDLVSYSSKTYLTIVLYIYGSTKKRKGCFHTWFFINHQLHHQKNHKFSKLILAYLKFNEC